MGTARVKKFCTFLPFLFPLVATGASAFQISPCLRILTYESGGLGQEAINWFNKCALLPDVTGLAVHEHLTNFSTEAYRGHGFITTEQVLSKIPAHVKQEFKYREPQERWFILNPQRRHSTSDLIYGSWWNDDPLMFLWGEGFALSRNSFTFREFFSDPDQAYYPAAKSYCKTIERTKNLGWTTHYGALQHLHFMSETPKAESKADRVNVTVEKSLAWIKFAYAVAKHDIPYNARLTSEKLSELRVPSLVDNYCLKNDEHVTVRTLFSRVDFPDDRRESMVPDVALGSIFHIIQDSFSPSHTCRIEETVKGKSYAVLSDVYNYADQVKVRGGKAHHGSLDKYPQWLLEYARTGVHKYDNDPINVGAWLLEAVDTNKDWGVVRDHLLNTVFKEARGERNGIKCIGT